MKFLRRNRTIDYDIAAYCNEKDLILVTKDEDFLDTYFIERLPARLIKIHLGNIATEKLIEIINKTLSLMEQLKNRKYFLIELYKHKIEISEA